MKNWAKRICQFGEPEKFVSNQNDGYFLILKWLTFSILIVHNCRIYAPIYNQHIHRKKANMNVFSVYSVYEYFVHVIKLIFLYSNQNHKLNEKKLENILFDWTSLMTSELVKWDDLSNKKNHQ